MFEREQRYLLLIRHGSVERTTGQRDEAQSLDSRGIKSAYATASVFAEQLQVEGIRCAEMWCSKYRHAREHAGVVKKALEDRDLPVGACVKDALQPSVFRRQRRENVKGLAEEVQNEAPRSLFFAYC